MNIDEIKNKIDKYISSKDKHPLVVDVCNIKNLHALALSCMGLKKVSIFDLSKTDELVSIGDLLETLNQQTNNVVVRGLGSYLKLHGENSLKDILHRLLSMTFKSKVICLTYQCSLYFEESDPRYRDNYLIVDGDMSPSCTFDLLNLNVRFSGK